MKILHVVEPFATGVLSFIQELSNYQVDQGHDVFIAYGVRVGTPSNVQDMFDRRIHMIRVKSFHGALKSLLNPLAYVEVRQIYDDVNPNVVHLHSSASGFVGRVALPCHKTKVFYTPHGYSFLSDNTPFLLRKGFWVIEKIASKFKSVTIACSKREFQDAIRISSKATFVNNGVNVDDLSRFAYPMNMQGQIVVCTSGRIIHQKNPVMFNQIAESLPHVKFVWIGEGEMRSVLKSSNITVTGWKDRDETLRIVGKSTFFILTSFGEGLSVSLLEAMAMQRVCIVRNVRGCKDVIRNCENGLLCNSVDEFVNAIKQVVCGELDGKVLSQGAYNDVITLYNSKLMTKQYLEIYNR